MSDLSVTPAGAAPSCGAGSCGPASAPAKKSFSLSPWLAKLKSPLTAIALIFIAVAILDREGLPEVANVAVSAFSNTLPIILMAVALIAGLKASSAESVIAQIFTGRENRMIVLAALLGGLAPFCSCQVIPFIAGLLAIGTPLPAVMAFWLSSPLLDPAGFVITAGVLGMPFAIGKATIAVAMGLLGGFVLKMMMRFPAFQSPLRVQQSQGCGAGNRFAGGIVWTFWQDAERRRIFGSEVKRNLIFLLQWMAFAYALEAIFILYLPADAVASVVGGEGLGAVIISAAAGLPTYLNGYAAPALLDGLMQQGMSSGSAMAFLTAGAISSIPAMTAVWSLVNRSVFAMYLGLGFTGAVMFGWLYGLMF